MMYVIYYLNAFLIVLETVALVLGILCMIKYLRK